MAKMLLVMACLVLVAACGSEAPQHTIVDVKMLPLSTEDELFCVETRFEVSLPFGGRYASILLSRRTLECGLKKRGT